MVEKTEIGVTVYQDPRTAINSSLLKLARLLVLALAVVAVVSLTFSLRLFPAYAATHPDSFLPSQAWTPETLAAATAELGWPPLTIPWFQFVRDLVNFAIYIALGFIVLLRGPRTWFGTFVGMTFIAFGYANSIIRPVAQVAPALGFLSSLISQLAWQLIFILFYVFPNGRFVPRWTRWLLLPWLGFNLLALPELATVLPVANSWWVPVPLVLSAIGSQVYRYFWHADPLQRAQTKWIVFVVGLLVPLMLAYGFIVPVSPDRAPAANAFGATLRITMIWQSMSWVAGLLIPIAIAIAILRYRLWDIDVIIRRTLVYTVLTAALALVYFGLVILLERALSSLVGSSGQVATVISTLAIFILFTPLRRRVQDFIDRRFYRRKYNAEHALAEFAVTARAETNLEALTAQVVGIVQHTMQPELVSLWLKPDAGKLSPQEVN